MANLTAARARLAQWRDLPPDARKGRPGIDKALFAGLEERFSELDQLDKKVEALEFQLANVTTERDRLEGEILSVVSGLPASLGGE